MYVAITDDSCKSIVTGSKRPRIDSSITGNISRCMAKCYMYNLLFQLCISVHTYAHAYVCNMYTTYVHTYALLCLGRSQGKADIHT